MSSRIPTIGHVQAVQQMLLQKSLIHGDLVVDATVGNGNDALLLLELIGANGFLYGFDVQQQAIDHTSRKLKDKGYENFKLFHDSHENLLKQVNTEVQGVIFNLGYLPAGDKTCTTKWETTKIAISQGMELIKPNGFVGVMTYPGHDNGMLEDQEINRYFSEIDQKKYQIFQVQFLNQQKNPPKLYWVTKRT